MLDKIISGIELLIYAFVVFMVIKYIVFVFKDPQGGNFLHRLKHLFSLLIAPGAYLGAMLALGSLIQVITQSYAHIIWKIILILLLIIWAYIDIRKNSETSRDNNSNYFFKMNKFNSDFFIENLDYLEDKLNQDSEYVIKYSVNKLRNEFLQNDDYEENYSCVEEQLQFLKEHNNDYNSMILRNTPHKKLQELVLKLLDDN